MKYNTDKSGVNKKTTKTPTKHSEKDNTGKGSVRGTLHVNFLPGLIFIPG